jgi:hypothetical protein
LKPIPVFWNLKSIPELAPYPPEERRRLWKMAIKASERGWRTYVVAGLFGALIGLADWPFDKTWGRSALLKSWVALIDRATGGLVRFDPAFLASFLGILLCAVAFWFVYALLLQNTVRAHLRMMLPPPPQ